MEELAQEHTVKVQMENISDLTGHVWFLSHMLFLFLQPFKNVSDFFSPLLLPLQSLFRYFFP